MMLACSHVQTIFTIAHPYIQTDPGWGFSSVTLTTLDTSKNSKEQHSSKQSESGTYPSIDEAAMLAEQSTPH